MEADWLERFIMGTVSILLRWVAGSKPANYWLTASIVVADGGYVVSAHMYGI